MLLVAAIAIEVYDPIAVDLPSNLGLSVTTFKDRFHVLHLPLLCSEVARALLVFPRIKGLVRNFEMNNHLKKQSFIRVKSYYLALSN